MPTTLELLAAAVQHHQAGRLKSAEQIYRRILDVEPQNFQAWQLLGVIGYQQGDLARAVEYMEKAIHIRPDYADAHYNLANAFKMQGNLDAAVASYRRFLELTPAHAEANNNLGNALQLLGNLDEATTCYRRALELNPNFAEVHNNLGYTLHTMGRLDEGLACYSRALALNPDYAMAHSNRALALLAQGDWQNGWPEFEWRWRTKDLPPRDFTQPVWAGEPLLRKTILLHAEQGLGDTIHFIRYAQLVKQVGAARVIVECQPALVGLLEGSPGVDQLIARNKDLPAFDVHAPLLSLPGIFKTSVETVPANVPYLFPKAAALGQWRERLASDSDFKIGINWQGNRTYLHDRYRSIPLRCFAPLAQIPGVQLISLQKGAGVEQLADVRGHFPVTDLGDDLDQSTPFHDTAAVMKLLDLVISVDAAPAHLSGALGVPTWLALSTTPSWRWLQHRTDTPWYPTMRLFRQKERGNWESVIEEMRKMVGVLRNTVRATP